MRLIEKYAISSCTDIKRNRFIDSACCLTDAFMNDRSLSPKLWNQTKNVLGARDFVDLISLVSQYVLFALNNVCMQIQVEPGVADLPGIED